MRDALRHLLAYPATERVITALILVNAVTLGLETSETAMAAAGGLLVALDRIVLAIFVVEIAARLLVHGHRFVRDPWSVFDFLVVGIALVPATGPLSVLRALRILRVLRLITIVPSLRRVVAALIGALPGMGAIVLLLLILFYVSAVMATKLFGDTNPDLFGTIGQSSLTLFQVMTLDGWSQEVVKPVLEPHPLAWAFFIPFILVTSFLMLNLFIGVVVNAIDEERMRETPKPPAPFAPDDALLDEMRQLRAEIEGLRRAVAAQSLSASQPR